MFVNGQKNKEQLINLIISVIISEDMQEFLFNHTTAALHRFLRCIQFNSVQFIFIERQITTKVGGNLP